MKKYIINLFLLSIFLVGCNNIQQTSSDRDNDVLNVELYDAQRNLITGSIFTAGAIVNNVPNVKYIKVKGGMKNIGNVELIRPLLSIGGHEVIINKLKSEMSCVKVPYTKCTGFSIQCIPPKFQRFERLQCSKPSLRLNEFASVSSHLIDVEQIGYGTFPLIARAYSLYIDDKGNEIETKAEKEIILIIKPDQIREGKISVDITTGIDIPPPPCEPKCPSGMELRQKGSGESKCYGIPSLRTPTNLEVWGDELNELEFFAPCEIVRNGLMICADEITSAGVKSAKVAIVDYGGGCQATLNNAIQQNSIDPTPIETEETFGNIYRVKNWFGISGSGYALCTADERYVIVLKDMDTAENFVIGFYFTCENGELIGDNCVAEPINVCIIPCGSVVKC